jgi:hypothetical protein
MRYISGSRGLKRIARAKCSMAPSGSPFQALRNPPRNQAGVADNIGGENSRQFALFTDHGNFPLVLIVVGRPT